MKKDSALILGMMYYGGKKKGDFCDPSYYVRSVQREGASLLLKYPGADLPADYIAETFDALLLSGSWSDIDPAIFGQDPHPESENFDKETDLYTIELLHRFRNAGKPVLGICYGAQILNVAYGGGIRQDIPRDTHYLMHNCNGSYHNTEVKENTLLGNIIGPGTHLTTTSHHQEMNPIAEGFIVSAVAEDGIVECIEAENALGIQWHPERMKRDWNQGLFPVFAEAARLGSFERALDVIGGSNR